MNDITPPSQCYKTTVVRAATFRSDVRCALSCVHLSLPLNLLLIRFMWTLDRTAQCPSDSKIWHRFSTQATVLTRLWEMDRLWEAPETLQCWWFSNSYMLHIQPFLMLCLTWRSFKCNELLSTAIHYFHRQLIDNENFKNQGMMFKVLDLVIDNG